MMKRLFADRYRIASSRLKNWDYGSEGCYFVTICTREKENYFGTCRKAVLKHSHIGEYAVKCWKDIPQHHTNAEIDEFVIMPNHVHGIVVIHNENKNWEPNCFGPQKMNLPSIIRGFKSAVASWAKNNMVVFGWQQRYYDRIVRDAEELDRIRAYIVMNPVKYDPEAKIDNVDF